MQTHVTHNNDDSEADKSDIIDHPEGNTNNIITSPPSPPPLPQKQQQQCISPFSMQTYFNSERSNNDNTYRDTLDVGETPPSILSILNENMEYIDFDIDNLDAISKDISIDNTTQDMIQFLNTIEVLCIHLSVNYTMFSTSLIQFFEGRVRNIRNYYRRHYQMHFDMEKCRFWYSKLENNSNSNNSNNSSTTTSSSNCGDNGGDNSNNSGDISKLNLNNVEYIYDMLFPPTPNTMSTLACDFVLLSRLHTYCS
jgi:hypothetical protein